MEKNLEKTLTKYSKNSSHKDIPQKIAEVGKGYLQGIVEHSFIFPSAIRKDFTDAVNPKGIKLFGWDYSARQTGYSASFLNFCAIGWVVPLGLNILMYNAVSSIDNSLTTPLMLTQLGTNVTSLLYELGRGIYKSNKSKKK